MKVEADIQEKYTLTMHNKDYAMGHHFSEDDWDLTVTGTSIEELSRNAAEQILESNICVDNWSLSVGDYIIYNNEEFQLSNQREISNDYKSLINDILHSDYFKGLKEGINIFKK